MRKLLLVCCAFTSSIWAADFTTYIGDEYEYQVAALTADSAGNTYVTGGRVIPGSGADTQSLDIFVTKLNPSGAIVFTTTLSGKSTDVAAGIAVDASGNIYICGGTQSANFPLRNAIQTVPGRDSTGFLVKLNPDGSIANSTYLGGTTGGSQLTAVSVDSKGDVYVTGTTNATDYPHTSGLPAGTVARNGPGEVSGAFFARISPKGDQVLYAGLVSGTQHICSGGSSCFLSAINTTGSSIAVDAAGNAYIAGYTNVADLPVTSGVLQPKGSGAFVLKVNASGTGLGYLTYLASANYGEAVFLSPATVAKAIAVDSAGNAYVVGSTSDPKFPTTSGTFHPVFSVPISQINSFQAPPSDGFISKLKPDGTGMVWSTFFGQASDFDTVSTVALDPAGNVYVTGTTIPQQGPGKREFVVKLDALASGSAFSPVPLNTVAASIAVDSAGSLRAAGATGIISNSGNALGGSHFYGLANAAGGQLAGRLAPGEIISLYGSGIGPAAGVTGAPSGGSYPTTLGGVQVLINGVAAPLLYAGDPQINAVVPNRTSGGSAGRVQVLFNDTTRADFRAFVDATAPQIFRNGSGAAAVNQDGSINSVSNPAPGGSYVAIYATGTGAFQGIDGQLAPGALPGCSCLVTRNDLAAPEALFVPYAGAAPGLVNGATQINFQVPVGITSGLLTIALGAGGRSSEGTLIFVGP